MRIHLNVPFAEKDRVRQLGGRWDGIEKRWFIDNVEDLRPFWDWLPPHMKLPHKADVQRKMNDPAEPKRKKGKRKKKRRFVYRGASH